MKKNGVALFLIGIMALSVFGVVNLTTSTKAEAATPTVTFLSTPAFANAGQPFTISGNVKTSTGSFVNGGQVTLYRYLSTGWYPFKILNVGYGGQFSTTLTPTGVSPYSFLAKYSGTTRYGQQYAPSTSAVRTTYIKLPTLLSIRAFNYPTYNYVTGTLRDSYNRDIPNQKVYIFRFNSLTSYKWVLWTTGTTDTNGVWHASDYLSSSYPTNYYAQFYETSGYFGSRTSVTPSV